MSSRTDRPEGEAAALARLAARPPDEPGVAVAVTRGGTVVAQHCAGLASLEHRAAIGPATRFHIVSMSKSFTAASVLLLVSRGALALDDDVRRHLPELPAEISRDGAVTVRHLLSMTSGLRDTLEIERLRGVWHASPSRVDELLELACRQRGVSAPAGRQYLYANVNFVLLEAVIARATGASAEAFRREAIYEPLGLSATSARPHEGIVVADLAEPYVADGRGGWTRGTHLLGIAGDPLITSLDDVTRWLLALRSGAIGGVRVRAAMAERARLSSGSEVYYGLGLAVRRYRGLTVLCLTGSQPGYKSHLAYVPERDLGLAILSNREDTSPTGLAASIMDRFLDGELPSAHPGRQALDRVRASGLGAAELAAVQGTYVDLASGEWARLRFEDGVLVADTLGDPLFLYYAEGGGVFRDADDYRATVPAELRLRVGREPGDVSAQLWLGGQEIALVRYDPPKLERDALADYAGRYESGELASRHQIRAEGGSLVVEYGPELDGELTFPMAPVAPDAFLVRPRAPGVDHRHVFRFERGEDGRVTGAAVTMERLKGVKIRKISEGRELDRAREI